MSGARILLELLNVLEAKNAKLGICAICNGGGLFSFIYKSCLIGGASAMLVERT
jgi:acetyl-CoA acetyltransferase